MPSTTTRGARAGAGEMDRAERERRLRLSELAEHAPAVLQVWEATGEPPPLKGASWACFRLETALGSDTEAGWQKYLKAVAAALREPTSRRTSPRGRPLPRRHRLRRRPGERRLHPRPHRPSSPGSRSVNNAGSGLRSQSSAPERY